jgi:formiminotetrahydrofolate cyclodeaminase
VQDQTVGDWLDALASHAPAPGGGAAAAISAAIGAALVSMVCNLTIGKPRYAEHEPTMTVVLDRATALREQALELAAEDAQAFQAVAAAYKLPRTSDTDKEARAAAIQTALLEAADVPLRTAELAAEVIALAGRICEGANVNVISDVAVAVSSARAALEAASVNVEINLAAMDDPTRRLEIARALSKHTPASGDAERIIASVRERIGQ